MQQLDQLSSCDSVRGYVGTIESPVAVCNNASAALPVCVMLLLLLFMSEARSCDSLYSWEGIAESPVHVFNSSLSSLAVGVLTDVPVK